MRAAGVCLAIGCAPMVDAAGIEYSLTSLGSDVWRYDYTLDNTGPSLSFDEFTIFFDLPGVVSIDSFVVPVGWDPITAQPDAALPASGFVDALRLAGPVPSGSFSGFSAEFHYAPGLTPESQMFQLILAGDFDHVIEGQTLKTPPIVTPVPEPETYALMLAGLGVVGWAARRRQHASAGKECGATNEGASA